jgi:hypothetical protein
MQPLTDGMVKSVYVSGKGNLSKPAMFPLETGFMEKTHHLGSSLFTVNNLKNFKHKEPMSKKFR